MVMRKLVSSSIQVIVIAVVMSACSDNANNDVPLPTLAQLPTAASASSVPQPTAIAPSQIPSDVPSASLTPDSGVLDLFATLTTATPPFTLDSQPMLFPTLIAGTEITLQGRLTISEDNQVILRDDSGNTLKVIVDDFIAQLANNQVAQVTGTIEEVAGIQVIRSSAVKVIEAQGGAPTIEFALPPNGSETPLPPGAS